MNIINWNTIDTLPKNDTKVVIGQYFEDTYDGYYGESRWIWIIQGSFDELGNFFDDFNDEEIIANHMVCARQPTHWTYINNPPY